MSPLFATIFVMKIDLVRRYARFLANQLSKLPRFAVTISTRYLAIAVDEHGAFPHVLARIAGHGAVVVWDEQSENVIRSVGARYNPLASHS